MPRFYVPPEDIHGQTFTLKGSEARHAALVLRKKTGDTIEFFDGKDRSYQGRIESISEDHVRGVILEFKEQVGGSSCRLTLYQAVIKGPKWDWLVEKASEIGVSRLVPIITTRTVVKPSRETALDRWKRIALAASKQCGRPDMMEVFSPVAFSEALRESVPDSLTLMAWEKESEKSIRQACRGFKGREVRLFIGPEGGWENGEVERAVQKGAQPVRLGRTLLRSETAGMVAAALVLNECGVYS